MIKYGNKIEELNAKVYFKDLILYEEWDERECRKAENGDEVVFSETHKIAAYPLREISLEELRAIRSKKTPSFVMKLDGKYFYTKIRSNTKLLSQRIFPDSPHLCGNECQHMSTAPDELGGCPKVRHLIKHIEDYPWITCGYETFNLNKASACFVVLSCEHFEKCPPRSKPHFLHTKAVKLSLAKYVYEDVESLEEAARRREASSLR